MTIFIAIMGGLLSVLFRDSTFRSPTAVVVFKAAGVLLTLLFWILQERTMRFWRHFVDRAASLEKELGYRQYGTLPGATMVTGTNAIRLFFLLLVLFWIISLFLL